MSPTHKHRLEYGLVRILVLPLRYLPYRMALAIAWAGAALAYALMPRRRATAVQRIGAVFGAEMPTSRARHIAWISWRNIVFNIVDLIRFPRMNKRWLSRVMNTGEALEALSGALPQGKGAILALPHTGSWELAGAAAALADLHLFSIAADQRNRQLTDYINALRSSHGTELLSRGRANLRTILRRLRAGDLFAILPDLRQRTEGIRVNFLGSVANVGAGMATFSRVADVPIVLCYMTREGWTRHRFQVLQLITPNRAEDKEADIQRMTQDALSHIGSVIRSRPEQWFWHNRRWVLEPFETND